MLEIYEKCDKMYYKQSPKSSFVKQSKPPIHLAAKLILAAREVDYN